MPRLIRGMGWLGGKTKTNYTRPPQTHCCTFLQQSSPLSWLKSTSWITNGRSVRMESQSQLQLLSCLCYALGCVLITHTCTRPLTHTHIHSPTHTSIHWNKSALNKVIVAFWLCLQFQLLTSLPLALFSSPPLFPTQSAAADVHAPPPPPYCCSLSFWLPLSLSLSLNNSLAFQAAGALLFGLLLLPL